MVKAWSRLVSPAISAVLMSYTRNHIDTSPPFFTTKTRTDKCCNHVIFLCLIFWLDSIDIRTPNKNMEVERATISRMSSKLTHKQISLKPSVKPYLRRGPWKCWIKCIILQSFHSGLSQTSKMEFFFLTWSFLWKTIFAKRTPL